MLRQIIVNKSQFTTVLNSGLLYLSKPTLHTNNKLFPSYKDSKDHEKDLHPSQQTKPLFTTSTKSIPETVSAKLKVWENFEWPTTVFYHIVWVLKLYGPMTDNHLFYKFPHQLFRSKKHLRNILDSFIGRKKVEKKTIWKPGFRPLPENRNKTSHKTTWYYSLPKNNNVYVPQRYKNILEAHLEYRRLRVIWGIDSGEFYNLKDAPKSDQTSATSAE